MLREVDEKMKVLHAADKSERLKLEKLRNEKVRRLIVLSYGCLQIC